MNWPSDPRYLHSLLDSLLCITELPSGQGHKAESASSGNRHPSQAPLPWSEDTEKPEQYPLNSDDPCTCVPVAIAHGPGNTEVNASIDILVPQ